MYFVTYGKNKINFSIVRKERKALKISVSPDMKVLVIVSPNILIKKIEEKVKSKAGWIWKNLNYFRSLPPRMTKREYVSGETHMYLGRQYRLKVQKRKKADVKLKGAYIYLSTNGQSDRNFKQGLLHDWYMRHALKKYFKVLDKCYQVVEKYKIEKPSLQVRMLKSRWGSCWNKKRTILLNTELIKTPSHCIEYVIVHELCHLKYPNHDRKFYDFLSFVMPDWRERKERLERVVI